MEKMETESKSKKREKKENMSGGVKNLIFVGYYKFPTTTNPLNDDDDIKIGHQKDSIRYFEKQYPVEIV